MKKQITYFWKDIVDIGGACYAEEFRISGKKETGTDFYILDDFYNAVAEKHNVKFDDIRTFTMDSISFDPAKLPWGAESCGCWIEESITISGRPYTRKIPDFVYDGEKNLH